MSPTRPAWAPQDHLEPLLLARLESYPAATATFGTELVNLEQDDEGVNALLRDHLSGETRGVRARFVIGADGAHSTLRAQLGIRMEGPGDLAEFHTVQFLAPLARVTQVAGTASTSSPIQMSQASWPPAGHMTGGDIRGSGDRDRTGWWTTQRTGWPS